MSVCRSIVCQATVECCEDNIVPHICGVKGLVLPQDRCSSMYFVGLEDITVDQYSTVDLREGVHAYDGNGNEIEFTVEPEIISTDYMGEYEVTYTAYGSSTNSAPYMCGKNAVLLPDVCNTLNKITETRTVTVVSNGAFLCKSKTCSAIIKCHPAFVCDAEACISTVAENSSAVCEAKMCFSKIAC